MEYTREARCLDCKYYVPAPKPFAKSMCGLKENPTNRKNRVCNDWKPKYQNGYDTSENVQQKGQAIC